MAAENLSFGFVKKKKFTIEGDENRVVELNTSDIGVATRYAESVDRLTELADRVDKAMEDKSESDVLEILKSFAAEEHELREIFDYIFGTSVSEPIFGTMSPFSPTEGTKGKNGVKAGFAFEVALMVLFEQFSKDVQQSYEKVNKANIAKHTDKYTKK